MEITESFDLLKMLKNLQLLPPLCDAKSVESWWWPNALSFEVVVGAILVQNTRWEQVAYALECLKKEDLLNVESLAYGSEWQLLECVKHVGFFRQKTKRLQGLCQNLLRDFGNYERFCVAVSREWLLAQKGIGFESADAILNYALGREVLVVDKYSSLVLRRFGYALEGYEALQEWLSSGLEERYDAICALYGFKIPLSLLFARFHGKIVEYAKQLKKSNSKSIDAF